MSSCVTHNEREKETWNDQELIQNKRSSTRQIYPSKLSLAIYRIGYIGYLNLQVHYDPHLHFNINCSIQNLQLLGQGEICDTDMRSNGIQFILFFKTSSKSHILLIMCLFVFNYLSLVCFSTSIKKVYN